jgi:hypothetical protein
MKKTIFTLIAIIVSLAVNAQEPEKKKDTKQDSNGTKEERAINQSGISVKSKPKSKSSAKSTQPSTTDDKKQKEKNKEPKK